MLCFPFCLLIEVLARGEKLKIKVAKLTLICYHLVCSQMIGGRPLGQSSFLFTRPTNHGVRGFSLN